MTQPLPFSHRASVGCFQLSFFLLQQPTYACHGSCEYTFICSNSRSSCNNIAGFHLFIPVDHIAHTHVTYEHRLPPCSATVYDTVSRLCGPIPGHPIRKASTASAQKDQEMLQIIHVVVRDTEKRKNMVSTFASRF